MENYGDQLFINTTGFNPGKMHPVKNTNNPFYKPQGGLWTSTLLPDGESAWTNFCDEANFHLDDVEYYTHIMVEPTAKLYRIDTMADLKKIASVEPTLKKWGYIDFEELAKEYDGIYLSEQGLLATRVFDMLEHPINLNTWDTECTLWFRNVFTGFKVIREKRIDI